MDVSHSSNQSPQPDSTQLAQDRLQQMAHFQAGFLGTASHELRAPINKIISLHQLILEDLCENPEEEREFVEQANQAIFQVLQNLDLLIQVSKFDIGAVNPKLQPVFVQGVLDQVQQLTNMKCLNRQCRLTVEPVAGDLLADSDNHWLQQVLLLLVDGALVAGSAMISLAAQAVDDSAVTILLTSDVALGCWQPSTGPERAVQPTIKSTDISPGFRYQIAERMVAHLNGTLTCRSTGEDGAEIVMALPAVSL